MREWKEVVETAYHIEGTTDIAIRKIDVRERGSWTRFPISVSLEDDESTGTASAPANQTSSDEPRMIGDVSKSHCESDLSWHT